MSCQAGFYHSAPFGRCLACPFFCPTCVSPTNCSTCAPAYYLSPATQLCRPCSTPNCYSCSNTQYAGQCSLCRTGYMLTPTNQCTACPSGCDICSNSTGLTLCSTCSMGYYSSTPTQCAACPDGCSTCTNSSSCVTCSPGSYLTLLNACAPCLPSCSHCQSGSTCSQCNTGFYWVPSADTNSSGSCSPCSHPCLDCEDSASNCLICTARFQLTGPGQCGACEKGCQICEPSYGCLHCMTEFAPVENMGQTICVSCPPNCQNCTFQNNQTVCDTCYYGYTMLDNGLCYACGQDNLTEGCSACSGEGLCTSCMQGFSPIEGGCQNDSYEEGDDVWGYIYAMISLSCVLMGVLSNICHYCSLPAVPEVPVSDQALRLLGRTRLISHL